MPGKPFTSAMRAKQVETKEESVIDVDKTLKDAWDTDSESAGGEIMKKKKPSVVDNCESEAEDEVTLSSGCRVSSVPAKNQTEDPVTLVRLIPGRTVTIISPNGESRLTYNIATLLTVAKTSGKWMMPPHFREDMDEALLDLIYQIDPKVAQTKLPKPRNEDNSQLDDDLINELHQVEQEANENSNYTQHLHLLSAFNLGNNVSRRNIYFCPHCWDEAVNDARGPESNTAMQKPTFLRKADEQKDSDSDSSSSSNTDPTTRAQSAIDCEQEDEEDEEEEESTQSGSSSSSSSSSSSELSMTGHLNMEVFEQKKLKLQKRHAREDQKKAKRKPALTEKEEYDKMDMTQRRHEYGLRDPLHCLWRVDDRVEVWRNILFSTAQKARAHIKTYHGSTRVPVVETLRDKITRYIENRNHRFMESPWFDESKLSHQAILAPSNHAYWFWFARYNVMRYNTMLAAVEQSDGGGGTKFVTEQNAHAESDSSSHICDNSTSSSEVNRRREKMKRLRKKKHDRKSERDVSSVSSSSSSEEATKVKEKAEPPPESHKKRRKQTSSDEDMPAF